MRLLGYIMADAPSDIADGYERKVFAPSRVNPAGMIPVYIDAPDPALEREIATTTRHNAADAKRMADALAGAPTIVLSGFRAMDGLGCYSVEEMLERIAALRQMAK